MLKNINKQLILDAGCSSGFYSLWLASRQFDVIGVDISLPSLKVCMKKMKKETHNGLNLVLGDVENLPFRDFSFGTTLCSEVLEHVIYPHLAIKEIVRVTKPGGTLVISVPQDSQPHVLDDKKLALEGVKKYLTKLLETEKALHLHSFTLSSLKCAVEDERVEVRDTRCVEFVFPLFSYVFSIFPFLLSLWNLFESFLSELPVSIIQMLGKIEVRMLKENIPILRNKRIILKCVKRVDAYGSRFGGGNQVKIFCFIHIRDIVQLALKV